MNKLQIKELIDSAAANLRSMGTDFEAHIQDAAEAIMEEASEAETKPKLSIPYTISVDLSKSPPAITYKLKVGIARSLTIEGELSDPRQNEEVTKNLRDKRDNRENEGGAQ